MNKTYWIKKEIQLPNLGNRVYLTIHYVGPVIFKQGIGTTYDIIFPINNISYSVTKKVQVNNTYKTNSLKLSHARYNLTNKEYQIVLTHFAEEIPK